MITLEITTLEKIYLPKDSQIGKLIKVSQGTDAIDYEGKIEGDESGRRYVNVPIKQKILVPDIRNIEDIAVYEGDKLLFKGERIK